MLLEQDDPLFSVDTPGEEDDTDRIDAFRRGMHLRSDKDADATFWNELKKMACENRKGMARLLQVSPSVIGRWPAVIDNYMQKVGKIDAYTDGQKRPQMIPTGDTKIAGGNKPVVGMQGQFGDTNMPSNTGPF